MGNQNGSHQHHSKWHTMHGFKKGLHRTPSSAANTNNVAAASNNATTEESRTDGGQPDGHDTSKNLPIDRVLKVLLEKSLEYDNVEGISLNTFTLYLFPRYQILAEKLFMHFMQAGGKNQSGVLAADVFRQQCESFLAILDDDKIRDLLVRMFANDNDVIRREELTALLMCAYHVSMDHYSEGPQMCLSIGRTLKAVVDSCFHSKEQLSCQFVSHWLTAHCPRLLLPLHRYIVHSLATAHRSIESDGLNLAAGLELATPVLEHQNLPFFTTSSISAGSLITNARHTPTSTSAHSASIKTVKSYASSNGIKGNDSATSYHHRHKNLLQMSMSWLLAGALSPIYSRPQRANSPGAVTNGLSANSAFLSKLICSVPSHWIVLYDSDEMGCGANRFLHHVLSYKGPTLCLLQSASGPLFCVASPNEWRESNLYWGDQEAAVIQLLPEFVLLEHGAKMLYLNMSVRGYPHGLRAGKDPRDPLLVVESGFDKMQIRKVPYNLDRMEVWGCGDQISRDQQLDIKKWEVKEAERQRCVKMSAADWLDHPDRYLLELAGRTQYHHQNQ